MGDNVRSLMPGAIARLMRLVAAVTAAVAMAGFTAAQSERALTSELREACDFAYSVAAKTPGVSIHRRAGTFQDETLAQPVRGCGLDISGSFAKAERTDDAAVRLRQAFEAAGWEEMADYGADGKDGTSFAFRKDRVSCFARGTWNGGADGPDLPGEDWYKVKIFCATPVFPERQLLERIVIIVPKDGWRLTVTPDGAARVTYAALPQTARAPHGTFDFEALHRAFAPRVREAPCRGQRVASVEFVTQQAGDQQALWCLDDAFATEQFERAWTRVTTSNPAERRDTDMLRSMWNRRDTPR